jgi:hypothetical protein
LLMQAPNILVKKLQAMLGSYPLSECSDIVS